MTDAACRRSFGTPVSYSVAVDICTGARAGIKQADHATGVEAAPDLLETPLLTCTCEESAAVRRRLPQV